MPIRRVLANIAELIKDADQLLLTADAAAAASSLTVQSILGVSTNKLLFIGEPGAENSEIIATHSATSPSGSTVTLASTLAQAHPAGTVVYVIPFNQVRFYRSATEDDANVSDSGLTALAAAQNIDPTSLNNHFDDTTYTSGYYYFRFSDSVNTVNGLYSAPIPWGLVEPTFARNQVGYILDFVQRKLGFDWSDRFSKQTAMEEINECLQFIDGKQMHWSNHIVTNYAVGQTSRGVFEIALPTNIYDNQTRKSILNVKIGGQNIPLVWKDEKEFKVQMGDAIRSTVRTQASVGATSLAIANSYDFSDSGTVHVYTSNTDDELTYTGVTRSATTGILTGIPASGDGSIAATHAVGLNVWQNASEGQPLFFTVSEGYLRIWPLANSTFINKNILLDYYTVVAAVDSEDDEIDVERYDMVKHFLLWKAKSYTRNDGKDDVNDADYSHFNTILADAIRRKPAGQKFKMKPKINQIGYGSRNQENSKYW